MAITPTPSRVFVTHSSVDQALAQGLVDALRSGTSIGDRIFCSSVDGLDVENGEDFHTRIGKELQRACLVIPLITPAYLDSAFCMWELGAAWGRRKTISPVRVEQVKPSDLPELLRSRQVKMLTVAGLDSVANAVARAADCDLNSSIWQRHRDDFIQRVPAITAKLRTAWSSTERAKQRRAEKVTSAASEFHDAIGYIRDAGYLGLLGKPASHLREPLRDFTRSLARFFTSVTGGPCRITLKQTLLSAGPDGSEVYVKDITRSHGAVQRGLDAVRANTDFNDIVMNQFNYFFENDLDTRRATGQYDNSHLSTYGGELPYKSTIVWPIRKLYDDADRAERLNLAGVSEDMELIGFLCVDANRIEAFVEESDAHFGAAAAAALFPVLYPYLLDLK